MNRLLQLLTAPSREARLEATLRRIVEAHALAMWANTSADQETYERLANERDDAIEAAAAAIE
jgi:E3 ubiquitin-protein ligase DOA10